LAPPTSTGDAAIQDRLAVLVRAGELFHRSLELQQTLSNVARMAVEAFADLCLFDLIDARTGRLYLCVGAHRDPKIEATLTDLVTPLLQAETHAAHPARRVSQTGTTFFVPVFDEATLLEHASSAEHEAFMRTMKYRSKIVVPVVTQERIFGALTFVRTSGRESFDVADREVAEELGRRAGLAVANAERYARDQATQQRLALLVRAGELFHRSLDVEETLSNVAKTAIESFSDLCLFDLLDEETNQLYVSVGAHRDPEIAATLAERVTPVLQLETRRMHPARYVAQTGQTYFVPRFDEANLLEHASSDEHEAFMREMRYGSKIVVPVSAQGALYGALTFVRVVGEVPFEAADREAAEELGRRAGLALANAKQYGREQATQRRLSLLVRAGELFHRSLDLEETLTNVARTTVESFADLCLFDLIDENTGRLYVSVGAHRDPEREASLKALVTPILQGETRGIHPARYVAQTGETFFVPTFDEATLLRHASSDEHEAFMRFMRYRSKIVVPVEAQGAVFGALTFVRTIGSAPFDRSDMGAAQELGRRAGLAVANAKQFSREQHVAETLQRAFLSESMPDSAKMQFSAMYQAAQDESALGGDWYDAFKLHDRIVMTIGDVTGKGVDAARLMVQLRQWVRMAAIVTMDPGKMLTLLNEALVHETAGDELATAFIAVLDAAGSRVQYASAGHPPPLVREGDGSVRALPLETALPLGADANARFAALTRTLDDVSLLVLYTDGLTEVHRDPVAGEKALVDLLGHEEMLVSANPARFIMRLAAEGRARDDVAVLVVRLDGNRAHWGFDVADSASAYAIKQDYLSAVRAYAGRNADTGACETIFSELVGNALRHAPGRLSLALSTDDDGLWLHVMDEGQGFDAKPALPRDIWSESGRGLFLVHALAGAVAVRRLPQFGSYVKVLLPVTRSSAPPA
jgi:GAF domain-containing protein/anti-sigma regulatory factor (Ser/Thr protein kinase)